MSSWGHSQGEGPEAKEGSEAGDLGEKGSGSPTEPPTGAHHLLGCLLSRAPGSSFLLSGHETTSLGCTLSQLSAPT